jgi:hypothetical protein
MFEGGCPLADTAVPIPDQPRKKVRIRTVAALQHWPLIIYLTIGYLGNVEPV